MDIKHHLDIRCVVEIEYHVTSDGEKLAFPSFWHTVCDQVCLLSLFFSFFFLRDLRPH